MYLPLPDLALLGGAVFCGALIQGVTGYGNAILALPVIALLLPTHVPQLLALLALPLVIAMVFAERLHLDIMAAKHILWGRLVGTVGGLGLLAIFTPRALMFFFAFSTMAASVSFIWAYRLVKQNTFTRIGAGFLSGVMGTTAGIGGPPLAVLYARREGPASRATLGAVYLLGSIFSLIGLVAVGRVHQADLVLFGLLCPPLLAGFALSRHLVRNKHVENLRTLIIIIFSLSAATLLWQALKIRH